MPETINCFLEKRVKMKKLKRFMMLAMFIGVLLLSKQNAEAKSSLSVGDTYCTERYKFVVTKKAELRPDRNNKKWGEVKLVGFNPQYYRRNNNIYLYFPGTGLSKDEAYIRCDRTDEYFVITSIKPGAFKNCKKNNLCYGIFSNKYKEVIYSG